MHVKNIIGFCLKLVLWQGLVFGQAAYADGKQKLGGSKSSVQAVFKANEALHSSFFDYDAKQVEKAAKELQAAIAKVENKDALKTLSPAQDKLKLIKADAKREKNNENYHLVSTALIDVLEDFDVGEDYAPYSCPMVMKKWVQNVKIMPKVHNPYAPEMPHCGGRD